MRPKEIKEFGALDEATKALLKMAQLPTWLARKTSPAIKCPRRCNIAHSTGRFGVDRAERSRGMKIRLARCLWTVKGQIISFSRRPTSLLLLRSRGA